MRQPSESLKVLRKEIRHNPLLRRSIFVPAVFTEMASAFSNARTSQLDPSVAFPLGSASPIAFFVAPVPALMVYLISAMTLYLLRPKGV